METTEKKNKDFYDNLRIVEQGISAKFVAPKPPTTPVDRVSVLEKKVEQLTTIVEVLVKEREAIRKTYSEWIAKDRAKSV